MSARNRNWCFVINNPTSEDYDCCILMGGKAKYMIIADEIGDKCGTPHIQGYCELKNGMSRKAFRKAIGNRADCRVRYGTAKEAADYCKKGGVFREFGKPKKQGERNDLKKVRELVEDGNNMRETIKCCSSFQQLKIAEKMFKLYEKPRNWECEVLWFYGPTGTGKSKEAFNIAGDDYWVCGKNLKWWEGYDGHHTVIIDDFREDFCTFHELLRILDRYEYRIECKGGSRQLRAKRFIITCPWSPEQMYYSLKDEDVRQLLRRINEVRYFG
jgi:hypothetical protein